MSKRFYWLKLHDDFFDSKRIKKMRRCAGGDTMLVIYLKMQMIAMKHDGVIEYTGIEDNIAEELALDIDETTESVAATIAFLLKAGLCEMDGDNLFLPFAVSCVGSESSSAERVRQCRERQRALQGNVTALPCNEKPLLCNGEKEIEKDIEIDKEVKAPARPTKHKYGEYGHVMLTDDEMSKLNADYSNVDDAIRYLDEYIEMKGASYKSHYLAMRKWVFDAVREHQPKETKQANSSFEVDSFFSKVLAQSYEG